MHMYDELITEGGFERTSWADGQEQQMVAGEEEGKEQRWEGGEAVEGGEPWNRMH